MRTYTATSSLLTLSLLSMFGTVARADDAVTSPVAAPAATPAPAPQSPPPTAYSSAPPPTPFAPARWGEGSAAPNMHGPSVWGILPWGGVGVGARFMMPLAIRPLLANTAVRDNFALEFGADLLHWSYNAAALGSPYSYSWTEILPVVGAMWNIWLNDRFALYPKLEAGYAFGWFSNLGTNSALASYGGIFADGAVGALFNLGSGVTVRAEAGYSGLKIGAGWLF